MDGKKYFKKVSSVLLWILIWYLLCAYANKSLLIPIPGPADVIIRTLSLLTDGEFYIALTKSILRIGIGFLASFIIGTVCAYASFKLPAFKTVTSPVVELFRAMPVASFTVLVFLWASKAFVPSLIVFVTVLPVVWSNIENGLGTVDNGLIEMAHVFDLKKHTVFTKIIFPGIRPSIHASVTSGLGFAWKSGIAAEVICRNADSLGNYLWMGKNSLDYELVFAITLITVLLSILFQRIMNHAI